MNIIAESLGRQSHKELDASTAANLISVYPTRNEKKMIVLSLRVIKSAEFNQISRIEQKCKSQAELVTAEVLIRDVKRDLEHSLVYLLLFT